MVRDIGIRHWEAMREGQACTVTLEAGIVALDGEREMAFESGDKVTVTLRENAFQTVDVAGCMHIAADTGLFHFHHRTP
jgi:hypothetical protein